MLILFINSKRLAAIHIYSCCCLSWIFNGPYIHYIVHYILSRSSQSEIFGDNIIVIMIIFRSIYTSIKPLLESFTQIACHFVDDVITMQAMEAVGPVLVVVDGRKRPLVPLLLFGKAIHLQHLWLQLFLHLFFRSEDQADLPSIACSFDINTFYPPTHTDTRI